MQLSDNLDWVNEPIGTDLNFELGLFEAIASDNSNDTTFDSSQPEEPDPARVNEIKHQIKAEHDYVEDWRTKITQEFRRKAVLRVYLDIVPSKDLGKVNNERKRLIADFCRKLEQDVFALADSKQDYFELLYDKVLEVRAKCCDRKRQRVSRG